MKKRRQSAAMNLLEHVWETCDRSSWERINHSMWRALKLAIGSGMEFFEDDFASFSRDFRSGYWIGENREYFYSLAVSVENASAYHAFEKWMERKPIIADDVEGGDSSGYLHVSRMNRSKMRLAVGFRFPWKGELVTVTSFNGDGNAIACTYKESESAYNRKIAKRFTISSESIIADRAERKERDILFERATALAEKMSAKDILKQLKVKDKKDFYVLPIEKLRKQIEKMEKEAA